MLSEKDYLGYLEQLEQMEIRMGDFYGRHAALIDDPEIKKTFEAISKDEARHAGVVESLKKLVLG
jgi:rubrerythrin